MDLTQKSYNEFIIKYGKQSYERYIQFMHEYEMFVGQRVKYLTRKEYERK